MTARLIEQGGTLCLLGLIIEVIDWFNPSLTDLLSETNPGWETSGQ